MFRTLEHFKLPKPSERPKCKRSTRSIVCVHEALDVAGAGTVSCVRNTNTCATKRDGVDLEVQELEKRLACECLPDLPSLEGKLNKWQKRWNKQSIIIHQIRFWLILIDFFLNFAHFWILTRRTDCEPTATQSESLSTCRTSLSTLLVIISCHNESRKQMILDESELAFEFVTPLTIPSLCKYQNTLPQLASDMKPTWLWWCFLVDWGMFPITERSKTNNGQSAAVFLDHFGYSLEVVILPERIATCCHRFLTRFWKAHFPSQGCRQLTQHFHGTTTDSRKLLRDNGKTACTFLSKHSKTMKPHGKLDLMLLVQTWDPAINQNHASVSWRSPCCCRPSSWRDWQRCWPLASSLSETIQAAKGKKWFKCWEQVFQI